MATARLFDPEKHALVTSKYPVKTRHQLAHIQRREIPVGLYPGKFASDADRQIAPVNDLPTQRSA